jgi:uncharacterized membrane protein
MTRSCAAGATSISARSVLAAMALVVALGASSSAPSASISDRAAAGQRDGRVVRVNGPSVQHSQARTLPRRWRFRTIDYPGSLWTTLSDINDRGQVVGDYSDITALETRITDAQVRSFVMSVSAGARVREADSFTMTGSDNTSPLGINNAGQVVGYCYDDRNIGHGFLRSADGREFTTIDHPRSAAESSALGINDAGLITGFYIDARKAVHGFLRSPGGELTDIDHPRGRGRTYLREIDNDGNIVGHYRRRGITRAFIRTPDGRFDDFRMSRADTTCALAINASGEVAGFFLRGEVPRGFVRSANGRRVVRIAHPRGRGGTMVFGINDRQQVVGFYTDSEGVSHGFIATPRR